MYPVRMVVETKDAVVEYLVHVTNRSKHALTGALRSGWRRYPGAKAVTAEFTEHQCSACSTAHPVQPVRRVFNRKRRAA